MPPFGICSHLEAAWVWGYDFPMPQEKPVSLSPLTFKEAVSGLLKVQPPEKKKVDLNQKVSRRKRTTRPFPKSKRSRSRS